jgi:hypothetical protein
VELNKEKERTGIKRVETNFPTAKTARLEQYQDYVRYFFLHKSELFTFYSHHRAEGRFYSYQGKQRALEEATNILVNGGKKYNRSRRKKKEKDQKKVTEKDHRSFRCDVSVLQDTSDHFTMNIDSILCSEAIFLPTRYLPLEALLPSQRCQ